MSANSILLLLHSGMRAVTVNEILGELSPDELRIDRQIHHIDTRSFTDDVQDGNWDSSEQYLIDQASEIRRLTEQMDDPVIKYYGGMPEIPHALALGAFLGDERTIQVFDFDRDHKHWHWTRDEPSLQLRLEGLPQERIPSSGQVAIRVEISSSIQDADVRAILGFEVSSDIRIRLTTDALPKVKTVTSMADAQLVREMLREALAAVNEYRPGTELIHLFVAAPVPVCFLLGQELRLRNNSPFQTYKYRHQETTKYQPAILLSANDAAQAAEEELTDAELSRAKHIRLEVWRLALREVINYSRIASERKLTPTPVWFEGLTRRELLAEARPFPPLPPIWSVVSSQDTVDEEPFSGEFGLDKSTNRWRLNDRLLLGLSRATDGNDQELQKLVRLFLYHEYLHTYHSLTKYNAAEVGRFPNSLERIDYMADLYAALHELDFTASNTQLCDVVSTNQEAKQFLANTIDLMLRSMWAFEPNGELTTWQIRRVRRYLNWYWRRVQVERAPDLRTALLVLAKQPTIELAGCRLRVEGRRELMQLDRLDPSTDLSIGLVTEDERLLRITASVNNNISALLVAFQRRDHSAIKVFFQGVFDEAISYGGALPK
jgi:SMODS-associated and fused to various effectors sensor domain